MYGRKLQDCCMNSSIAYIKQHTRENRLFSCNEIQQKGSLPKNIQQRFILLWATGIRNPYVKHFVKCVRLHKKQ